MGRPFKVVNRVISKWTESAILKSKEKENGHMIGDCIIVGNYLVYFYRNTDLPKGLGK